MTSCHHIIFRTIFIVFIESIVKNIALWHDLGIVTIWKCKKQKKLKDSKDIALWHDLGIVSRFFEQIKRTFMPMKSCHDGIIVTQLDNWIMKNPRTLMTNSVTILYNIVIILGAPVAYISWTVFRSKMWNFGDLKHGFESKRLKRWPFHPFHSQFMYVFMFQLIMLFVIPIMSS